MSDCVEELILFEFPEYEGRDIFKDYINYKLIGLESDKPILQIDDLIFQGTWNESIGTNLFFNKSKKEDKTEKYYGKSTKVLRFHRVLLEPKEKI